MQLIVVSPQLQETYTIERLEAHTSSGSLVIQPGHAPIMLTLVAGSELSFVLKTGETKIELLESIDPDGVIAKFIEKKGEGIHHIAFDVEDIEAEMKRMKAEGFMLLNEKPKKGADNKLVCFLHPKGTNSVLVELCQGV